MPQNILQLIQFLCSRIAKVEWSGVLFYSVQGDITNPSEMVLTIEDILPMNKGTAAYTEYSFDERVIDYMMENETMEKGWKMGHIHSHNTMGVFFSGTDWSELEDNAPNHNFYLSLIVNNFMEFCAKVCFIAESQDSKEFAFYAKNSDGEKYLFKSEEYKVEEKKLVVYDCAIDSPRSEISVPEEFILKVDKVIEDADKVAAAVTKISNTNYAGFGTGKVYGSNGQQVGTRTPSNPSTWGEHGDSAAWDDYDYPYQGKKEEEDQQEFNWEPKEQKKVSTSIYTDFNEEVEHFAMFVLNTGNNLREFADIEDIIKHYLKFNLKPKMLASSILEKYASLYDNFFDSMPNRENADVFTFVTEGVINEYENTFHLTQSKSVQEMLSPVIGSLKSMLEKFKVAK